ncbi:MAG: UbiA family prenyltransferase [Chitinophagales bacterium]|nr:UbiA family prenyltransferase [Chitinophagales bacterium]
MLNSAKGRNEKWWNALLHLRIPFSVYLMPVYWFALLNTDFNLLRAVLVFIVLHVFVYPASNGYNSFFDRDEQSIGGMKKPPLVTKELWYVVLAFDILSVLLSLLVNLTFTIMVLIYLLVSKAYSYDKIRLKKYPVIGTLTVVFFQGFFTCVAVQAGTGTAYSLSADTIAFALVSSLFLLGSYPMTQIYQHEEDAKHGDRTLSRQLGIKGTFIFTGIVFFVASVLICVLFFKNRTYENILIYLLAVFPVNIYFLKWYADFSKGKPVIDYEHTMLLNKMSSLLLSAAFILMLIMK